MKFHHVGVAVSEFDKSKPLYDAILDTLDFTGYDLPGHIAYAWGTVDNSFRIFQPSGGNVSVSTGHICFEAPTEAAVAAFYGVGMTMGAKGQTAPTEYVDWGMRHVTAMLEDFDGNLVEAVFVDRDQPAS